MSLTLTKSPPLLILAKQPVSFEAQSDASATPLRIKANITGNTDGDSVAADGNKKASFELSDYLQALITERYKTAATPAIYSNVPKPLTFDFTEYTGSPATEGDSLTSGTFYLLDGYVPHSRRKTLYAAYTSLLAYLVATKSYLSWWPLNTPKILLPDQKDFLNYLQLYSTSPINFTIEVTLFFTDGSNTDLPAPFADITGLDYMQMVYIPTGYTQLGIGAYLAANYPNKILDCYTVTLNSGGNLVSPVQQYNVDNAYRENVRYLYIRNAFGFLEILRCTGKGEQTNSFKFEMVRTDGRILPDRLNWKLDRSDTVKVNTGNMTAAQMQWLNDMDFLEAYDLIGGVLRPIVFKDLFLPVVHDTIYQYSGELEYEYAYNETTEQA